MQTLFLLIDCRKFTGIDVEKGSHLPIDYRKFTGFDFLAHIIIRSRSGALLD